MNRWTTLGPVPTTQSVAVDAAPPFSLYTGTTDGGFRSDDGGRTWTLILAPGAATSWVIVATVPRTIYAAGIGSVSRSADGGATWTVGSFVGEDRGLHGFAVDTADPMVVYASVGTDKIHRSTDGGWSWSPWVTGLPGFVGRIETVPGDSSTLFVETIDGPFRSTDGGAHWTNLPVPTIGTAPLAVAPRDPDRLWTCGIDPVNPMIAVSTDGGDSWQPGGGACPMTLRELRPDPFDLTRLWGVSRAEVFASRDGGVHWYTLHRDLVDDDLGWSSPVAVDPVVPGRVYAATRRHGVMVYDDRCGNGRFDAEEACDDGNGVPGDGCRPDCSVESHGDGVVDPNEECDDGNFLDEDGCDSNFRPTGCGNGIRNRGEDCDDGNDDPHDHCAYCRSACVVDGDCDDGVACTIDACSEGLCGYGFATGLASAICGVHDGLASLGCPDGQIPVSFLGRIAAIRREVDRLGNRSATPAERARQRRVLRRRIRHMSHLAAGLRLTTSVECVQNLRRRLRLAELSVALSWYDIATD